MSQRHMKVKCDICSKEISKNNIAIHRERHGIQCGGSPTDKKFQGIVKEGHPETETIDNLEYLDTVPQASENNRLDDTESVSSESVSSESVSSDSESENENVKPLIKSFIEPVYKNVKYVNNTPQIHRQEIVKNFKVDKVDGLNRRLTDVINNFNGHIKKLYNEKANKSDFDNLHRKVNGLNSSIEAIRRTLTEQSRMVGGVYNVYKHSKKHGSKTSKKVKKIIENIVENKVGCNTDPEEVLKNVNININAQKLSIERSYKLIQSLNININTLKARVEGHETRLKSVEETNNILLKNQLFEETNNILLKNQLTEEDVVRIVKRILSKEGKSVKTEEIVNIINNKVLIDTDEVSDEVSISDGKDLSKYFKEEMNELINKMRLTKKDELNKTTVKNMKNIIEKHSNMGHLGDIKKYMEALPKNKTKNNKKKAVARNHLHIVIKNIEVK